MVTRKVRGEYDYSNVKAFLDINKANAFIVKEQQDKDNDHYMYYIFDYEIEDPPATEDHDPYYN
jgi:hypothetical protein